MESKDKNQIELLPVVAVKCIFWLILIAWAVICSVTVVKYQEELRLNDDRCEEFHEGWVVSDTVVPVTIPGKLEGNGTVVRIQNTIPQDIDDRTTIIVKGLHQSMRVWIDGNLVSSLDNAQTRPFGRYTSSGYIRIPLQADDAGKIIEIEYSAPNAETAGQLNDIRIGSDMGILFWMMESYGNDLLFAVLLLYTGVVIVLLGIVMRFGVAENPNANIIYLGVSAICIATWMLFESRLRQFYMGNLAVCDMIMWVAMFLSPVPILFYISRLQERRYSKLYTVGVAIALLINSVMMLLEITNRMDFYDLYPIGWLMILGEAILVLYTITQDWYRGKHQWRLLIGILIILIGALLQMWKYTHASTGVVTNGYISIGMMLFMLIMGISAVSSMIKQKQEQELAIKANETKTDFLANMSHEIRTPINAMLGFDEMILREETDEQIIDYATNIKKAGGNLLSLINDILDFSKVESGKMEIIKDSYKTSNMLTDVITMTYMKAQEKGLSFDIFIGKNIPRVLYGDEMRVKQILTNVLNNAVKYTELGSIALSVNFDKLGEGIGRLRISVADTGIGIEQENISKITESFQRFDLQKNRSIEGTGLGMSIVAGLLKEMEGKLQVYSTYGKGSDFRILIPQEIRDETPIGNYQEDYRKGLLAQKPYRALFTAPQARILFVDDNIMNLSVAKGLLKKTKIQIDTADSGMGCLELTRKNHYDLIFMDHLMPEMDGVETLHRLRREEGNLNQYTHVIALTANAIKGSEEYYLSEGFHAYLTKPIEGERLEEVLFRMLPETYIIPAEESAEHVLDRLQAENGSMAEEPEVVTVQGCMKEIENMLKEAHIHVEEGYHFAGNSMGQFHWMIHLFADSFSVKYPKLLELYETGNEEMYTIEVHALKSNAKGIGARQLYQLAWEHEQQSRAGNWNYIKMHWEELCLEWTCVVNGILNYIGEEPIDLKEVAIAVETADNSTLTAEQHMLLDNCIEFVEEYETDSASAILDNLLREELAEDVRCTFLEAKQALEDLDYETAIHKLKQL